jgi:hypothetical protein
VDTLILLSTAQPLPDRYALNFEGDSLARGAESPLRQLPGNTSGGTADFPAKFLPTGALD